MLKNIIFSLLLLLILSSIPLLAEDITELFWVDPDLVPPMTGEEIKDKFRASVAFSKAISQESAEKALNMLDRLEELGSVADLVKTLTPD